MSNTKYNASCYILLIKKREVATFNIKNSLCFCTASIHPATNVGKQLLQPVDCPAPALPSSAPAAAVAAAAAASGEPPAAAASGAAAPSAAGAPAPSACAPPPRAAAWLPPLPLAAGSPLTYAGLPLLPGPISQPPLPSQKGKKIIKFNYVLKQIWVTFQGFGQRCVYRIISCFIYLLIST